MKAAHVVVGFYNRLLAALLLRRLVITRSGCRHVQFIAWLPTPTT